MNKEGTIFMLTCMLPASSTRVTWVGQSFRLRGPAALCVRRWTRSSSSHF